MATGSKRVIIAALVGNGLIAITKFGAATITGSSAMLAEGIHSVVDTGNQGLLLLGLRRARRPADEAHPFGHGAELYFWAFLVAILIFAVGSGVSLYEGIHKIVDPHAIERAYINFIVLGLAAIFEGYAWSVAFKEMNAIRGSMGIFEAVRSSKDPTVFTVLFEDTAAMLGLIVAAIGIAGAIYLEQPWLDGAASVLIGLILGATAFFLAVETKSLLVGEAASPETVAEISRLAAGTTGVREINEIRTLHRGPTDILLVMSLDFHDAFRVGDIENAIFQLESAIKDRFPAVRRIFIEAQSAEDHQKMLERARNEAIP